MKLQRCVYEQNIAGVDGVIMTIDVDKEAGIKTCRLVVNKPGVWFYLGGKWSISPSGTNTLHVGVQVLAKNGKMKSLGNDGKIVTSPNTTGFDPRKANVKKLPSALASKDAFVTVMDNESYVVVGRKVFKIGCSDGKRIMLEYMIIDKFGKFTQVELTDDFISKYQKVIIKLVSST